ncbi:MAG: cytochrome c [Gammaproteobacteria bacterium]
MSNQNYSLIKLITLTVLLYVSISLTHANEIKALTETDDLVIEGEKEYQQRCAVCHGVEGKGDGPYSFALIFKPSNLTTLLIENGGHFPFVETYLIIDARDMTKFHGTRLMPIWGDRYSQDTWSSVSPEHANTLVRGRIFELIMYLYSIQEQAL